MKTTFLLALLAAPILHAAPFDPKTIPSSAEWYLHGDLDELRKTGIGKIIIDKISSEENDKIAEVSKFLGFDPLTDLTDLTLFGDGKMNRAALIFGGAMNRNHLEEVIVQADDYQSAKHHGSTVHIWRDKGKIQYASFLDDRTLVFSEEREFVDLTLDVAAGRKEPLAESPALADEHPVVLGVARISNIELPADEGSKIIRKAESVAMALSEKEGRIHGRLIIGARSEALAKTLGDALAGLIAIGTLTDDTIADLGIDYDKIAEGSTMTMSMSLPATKALALLSFLK